MAPGDNIDREISLEISGFSFGRELATVEVFQEMRCIQDLQMEEVEEDRNSILSF